MWCLRQSYWHGYLYHENLFQILASQAGRRSILVHLWMFLMTGYRQKSSSFGPYDCHLVLICPGVIACFPADHSRLSFSFCISSSLVAQERLASSLQLHNKQTCFTRPNSFGWSWGMSRLACPSSLAHLACSVGLSYSTCPYWSACFLLIVNLACFTCSLPLWVFCSPPQILLSYLPFYEFMDSICISKVSWFS